MAFSAYYPILWIFKESELVTTVEFLARRLRDFALPSLARIHSMETLCDAFDTRPLTASPWFRSRGDYSLPLAFEPCGHSSLATVVAEMEAFWQQQPDDAWGTFEMCAFLARTRARQR